MITGQCLCGAVLYQAGGDPLFAVLCHCRDCQRISGTGHTPVLGMPIGQFTFTGETRTYAARGIRGKHAVRHFFPTCGSLLFGMPGSVPDAVSIYVGSLDDPSVFKPSVAVFTSYRHHWDRGAASLPEFVTLPDVPDEP